MFDFRSFRSRSFDGSDQRLTQKEAMILKELMQRCGPYPHTVRGIGYRFIADGEGDAT